MFEYMVRVIAVQLLRELPWGQHSLYFFQPALSDASYTALTGASFKRAALEVGIALFP